jgi:ribosome-binding factor A
MAKIRLQRVAEQLKHVISRVVTQELKDPRAGFITVTYVRISPDLKTARVNFSVLGSDAQRRTAQRALEHARGYIQARVAKEVALKYTPVIQFHFDESVERDIEFVREIDATVEADRRVAAARAIRASSAGAVPDDVTVLLDEIAASPTFHDHLAGLLTALMNEDTSFRDDLPELAAAEDRCFDHIEDRLVELWGSELAVERIAIDDGIDEDDAYTPPAYAATPGGYVPEAREVYADRANLVAVLRHDETGLPPRLVGEGDAAVELPRLRLALNAHVDTVPPYVPPSRDGDLVRGRGACDAKGQVAAIVGAFELLHALRERLGVRLTEDLCAQFVIDEESGGNGSLSLAGQDPFRFDGIVVVECTGGRIHVANRGAVWYRAEVDAPADRAAELAAAVILALDAEGDAIRDESDHPLFPARPVQTNHGILGPFGSAPCTVCDRVELDVTAPDVNEAALTAAVDRGVRSCCERHGDKEQARRLPRHVSIEPAGDGAWRIVVHGIAGHMGSLAESDGAITKAAHVIHELAALRGEGAAVDIRIAGVPPDAADEPLVLEGGQGFLPTHRLEAVVERLGKATRHAVAAFADAADLSRDAAGVHLAFDKLHNRPFERPVDSALAVYAEEACRRAGIDVPQPPEGWAVSCDARLFANFFGDRDVIVFGPGRLADAHSPAEHASLSDLARAAKMLVYLVLASAGFVR